MITVRHSADRGAVNMGWLNARHSFSFGSYYDPQQMGFGTLRVINEDRIEPAQGFGMHGHRDMEIITYIIDGALEHRDSMGNGSVIRAGDVQRMSAGTGVQHSEFNHSDREITHLLQIWLLPERNGISPGYEEKSFDAAAKTDRLCLIASREARDGSLKIHQDVDLHAAILSPGSELSHALAPDRRAWIQVVHGDLAVNDTALADGDGAAVVGVEQLRFAADSGSEFLLFDLG
jgi:redox-sensitive bicupin YhaK (pirin superfamily)